MQFAVAPAAARRAVTIGPGVAGIAEGVVAFYGGYFGAGLGVLFLALLTVIAGKDLSRVNVVKIALAMLTTSIAEVIFAFGGTVMWAPAELVFVGAAVGGMLGDRLACNGSVLVGSHGLLWSCIGDLRSIWS